MADTKPLPCTTYYTKNKQGEFIPVAADMPVKWRKGAYLVQVRPGCESTSRAIEPDYIEAEAALRSVENELVTMLLKASEAQNTNLTEKQREAFEGMQAKLGEDMITRLYFPSASDIASKFIALILDKYKAQREKIMTLEEIDLS